MENENLYPKIIDDDYEKVNTGISAYRKKWNEKEKNKQEDEMEYLGFHAANPDSYAHDEPSQVEEKEPVKEHRYHPAENSTNQIISASVIGIALVTVMAMAGLAYKYIDTGTLTYETKPAVEVMEEMENYPTKAEKLNPDRVYKIKDGGLEVMHNMAVSIEQIQFRKDTTRLWVHMENKGTSSVKMMPAVDSVLVDNNGHTYKVDHFAGSKNLSGIPAGTNEDILLCFEPIRSEASSITLHINNVFDMKNTPWDYQITVDIP